MKCYLRHKQKSKHKLSSEDRKKVQGRMNEFMSLSIAVGSKKALEILRESKTNEKEDIQYHKYLWIREKRDFLNSQTGRSITGVTVFRCPFCGSTFMEIKSECPCCRTCMLSNKSNVNDTISR